MTNDAAVAWVVVDQTLRKDSPDPNFMNGAYWTSFETVSADRALSVVKERQSIRPTGEYEVIALVPATTVAELRAEVERLQALSAAISRDCNECANQRNEANARADAAERRVAELHGVLSDAVGRLYRIDINGLDAGETHKLDVLLDRLQTALTKESP